MTDYISDSEMDQIRACGSASPAQVVALVNEVRRLKADLATSRRKAWEAGRDAAVEMARLHVVAIDDLPTADEDDAGVFCCKVTATEIANAIAALQPPPEDA